MNVKLAVGLLAAVLAWAPQAAAQAGNIWVPPSCELKPGHGSVNKAISSLKNATQSRLEDQRQQELGKASQLLAEALTAGGQQQNPAAWYYLGRYYYLLKDLEGADSAFTKAEMLGPPACKDDISFWRRQLWVPVLNTGIQAWQAGNTDSAIATFRRANIIYRTEPHGFLYLGSLYSNANEIDSAITYFKLAVRAATDTQFVGERKDALFSLARVYHYAKKWDDAAATYRDYLTVAPRDVEATAGLAAVYSAAGKRQDALALYAQILEHADSASDQDLVAAGVEIYNGAPRAPDTSALGAQCRTEARRDRTLTARRIAARCDSVTAKALSDHDTLTAVDYRMAARAFEAALGRNPYSRDALYNLANAYLILGDTVVILPLTQRLYALDPLHRESLRLLAWSWRFRGNSDSTLHYLTVGEGLPVDITVTTFAPQEQTASVGGLLTNFQDKANPPFALVFEFLNEKGEVIASQPFDVPAIEPQGNQSFQLRASGTGIVAWRYKKSG